MDRYVTAAAIRALREKRNMTQLRLAEQLHVSDKAVSKWETGRGLPDVTLLEPLAAALNVSLSELLSGEVIINRNVSANMRRSKLYVCPLCGNIMVSAGQCAVTCCGITLPPLEAEAPDEEHPLTMEKIEDEYYVTMPGHPMTRRHYVSFLAYVTDNCLEVVKLYPEGACAARFRRKGAGDIYACCNCHGLYRVKAI